MAFSLRYNCVLFALLVLALSAGLTPPGSSTTSSPIGVAAAQSTPTASNTTTGNTTRHVDPSTVESDDEEFARVGARLRGQLYSRLSGSLANLTARNFDASENLTNEEYAQLLTQYQQIAAQTATTSDDQAAQQFAQARLRQRNLTDRARRVRRLYNQYQAAKANGNTTRARQLARDLTRTAAETNQTLASVQENYEVLNRTTNADISREVKFIQNAQANVEAARDEVVRREFTETSLALNATRRASYAQPLALTGRLTANGSGVSNQTIQFEIGSRTLQTRTNETGRYTVTYRPQEIRPGNHSINATFNPALDSTYASATATRTASIRRISPELVVTTSPTRARFGQQIRLSGTAEANGSPVATLPLVLTVNGHQLATTTTTSGGTFNIQSRLPANVSSGPASLRLTTGINGSLVEQKTVVQRVEIAETTGQLTLVPTVVNRSSITVTGSFTTNAHRPVPNQSVVLRLNERPVTTVQTDRNGTFTARLTVPDAIEARNVELRASHSSPATNLRATTQLTVQRPPPFPWGLNFRQYPARWGLILVGLLTALLAWLARDWFRGEGRPTPPEERTPDGASTASEGSSTNRQIEPSRLLQTAQSFQAEERFDRATALAYGAVRQHCTDAYALSDPSTHWEFFRACRPHLSAEEQTALEELTAAYERVTYAGATPASETAARNIDRATDLLKQ